MLVNGLKQYAELWGTYRDALAAKHFRVVTFDLLGQGDSDKPSLFISQDDHVAVLRLLIDQFGDGLTTDLSRIVGSFVIARNTAFTFKDKATDVKQVGRELNIRYVLEGSVQRVGNRLRIFEGVVARCIATGLVGGEAFSIDASLIKADVDKKKRVPGDQPIAWPKAEEASHAVREYLAAMDTARGDEGGSGDAGGSGKGGDRHKPPKEVSLTDPQATWVARPGLDPFFAYDANYLIDNKAGIIIDAQAVRN